MQAFIYHQLVVLYLWLTVSVDIDIQEESFLYYHRPQVGLSVRVRPSVMFLANSPPPKPLSVVTRKSDFYILYMQK